MTRRALCTAAAATAALLAAGGAACTDPAPPVAAPGFPRLELSAGENPLREGELFWSPQPVRGKPRSIAVTPDGKKAYVALPGREDVPLGQVAVVDLPGARVARRLELGRSPWTVALHPGGRFLVVLLRYASFAKVVDTRTDRVVAEVPVPFYTEGIVFSPDGRTAWLANRWKDSVLSWQLEVGAGFAVTSTSYDGLAPDGKMGIPVGTNPRPMALSADGGRLFVGSVAGLAVSVIDTARGYELRRIRLNAPVLDLAVVADRLFVSHPGPGTGHRPDLGFDGDRDGAPGDGTANVVFQDVQNEVWVYDTATLERVAAYTSDTICCRDFRDVDPDHPERGAALAYPDTWPASHVAFLPPKETWLLAGSLPEALAVVPGAPGRELYVAFSGSNEVQGFSIGVGGALVPLQTAGELFPTRLQPVALAWVPGTRRLLVAERLSDSLALLDLDAGPSATPVRIDLSPDPAAPPFPATDAELGEAFTFVTGPFTVDGDGTCVHCHREGGNLEKSVAMPLQASVEWGTRQVMAARGAFDSRPWFFETAMTEDNFFPVINEFDRKENFCCEAIDPLIWSRYPTPSACVAASDTDGCNHVLRCTEEPPPECAVRGYGSPHPTRGEHFLAAAQQVFGRTRSFGDVLDDGSGTGVPLDFDGVTRTLGVFVLREPRLLPNPNSVLAGEPEARGEALYHRPDVGCSICHPLPSTTIGLGTELPGLPLRFPPVVSPLREPGGADADRITPGFLATFPLTVESDAGLHVGVTQVRGIWDRGNAFLHHGGARTLREVLATPGHRALAPGQVGFNERDGLPNTHGGTSQLSPADLAALEAFMLTL